MLIEREYMEKWLLKIMSRFDELESKIAKKPEKERHRINGELLLDNQDLCIMLNVSKRTLQRYRSEKKIAVQTH